MVIPKTVGSHHQISALAALVLVLLTGVRARAEDQPTRAGAARIEARTPPPSGHPADQPISPKAGAARIPARKPQPSGPTPMVKRGLILPTGLLDVYAGPLIDRPVGDEELRRGTSLGVIWGVVPELQIDFQVGPFYLSPELSPGTSRVTMTGRIVKTQPVDVGLALATMIDPSMPNYVGLVQPGMPAIFRLNNGLRVDTGVAMPIYTTADPHIGFRVPVNVYFQITDRVHFGATSSLFIADLRDPRGTESIPVGLTGGYSAGPELGFLAITPYITWTNFYAPTRGAAVDTRSFIAGVVADAPIHLP